MSENSINCYEVSNLFSHRTKEICRITSQAIYFKWCVPKNLHPNKSQTTASMQNTFGSNERTKNKHLIQTDKKKSLYDAVLALQNKNISESRLHNLPASFLTGSFAPIVCLELIIMLHNTGFSLGCCFVTWSCSAGETQDQQSLSIDFFDDRLLKMIDF